MSDSLSPGRARHALLSRAGLLPLARAGEPLRRALREAADDATRIALVKSWREALDALHAAGFGTEDAIANALVAGGRAALHPDGLWPLGATCGARPVASRLDLDEARRWLTAQGRRPDGPDLAALMEAPDPWPGYPEPPGEGLTLVVGHAPELHALCLAARVPCVGLGALDALHGEPRTSARKRVLDQLVSGRPLVLAVSAEAQGATEAAALGAVPTFPRAIVRGRGLGRQLPLTLELAEALGIEAHLLPHPPPLPRTATPATRSGGAPDPAGAFEAARMEDSAEARARAQARALALALDEEALPLEDAVARLTALIDLAREGLDREAGQLATLRRALATWPSDPKRAAADLTEVRRLGQTRGAPRLAQLAACAGALHHLLLAARAESPPFDLDQLPDPGDDASARALIALARVFGGAGLEAAPTALALAFVPPPGPLRSGALALVIELIGATAIPAAREEEAERLLRRLERFALPPAAQPGAAAWIALLAARRGAQATARERLLALVPTLQRRRDGLGRLAAERAALAARTATLDGLFEPLLALARLDGELGRHLEGRLELPGAGPLPPWLAVIGAESLLAAPESTARRLLPALQRAAPRGWEAPGLELALGRLEARVDPIAARERLLRTAQGEPHHEERALAALLALTSTASAEHDAIETRLRTLQGRRPPEPRPLAPPPLTPEAGEARALDLVERAAAAAASADRPWQAAIEAVLGLPRGPVPTPEAAALGLFVLAREGDHLLLEAADGQRVEIESEPPGSPPAPGAETPELAARVLAAFAPLCARAPRGASVPNPDRAPRPSPEALEAALQRRELDFFGDLQPAFKRHQLTLGELRHVVHLGLLATRGLYRALADRWGVADYQRLMDFLRRSDALLDYRPYRRGTPPAPSDA